MQILIILIDLIMSVVSGRNVVTNYIFKALCVFYSRIVLRKLDNETKLYYRETERNVLKFEKINADLCFLKTK